MTWTSSPKTPFTLLMFLLLLWCFSLGLLIRINELLNKKKLVSIVINILKTKIAIKLIMGALVHTVQILSYLYFNF